MDPVNVIVVVGTCEPERAHYAARLAEQTSRTLTTAKHLVHATRPASEAAEIALWSTREGSITEAPTSVEMADLIGAFADNDDRTLLQDIICVVDAAHLLADLHCDSYLPRRSAHSSRVSPLTARAQRTVTQIEHASHIELINWQAQTAAELQTLTALVSHLNPEARVTLATNELRASVSETPCLQKESRAGWMRLLSDDFDPPHCDARVSAFRYEQLRPLHPARFMNLLDRRVEPGEFGTVVRSAGFCRLATRANIVAHWDHVGRMISISPVAADEQLAPEDEILAIGQELAFIGLDLDVDGLTHALDEAALSDAELAAGAESWVEFKDDFPLWISVHEH